MSDNNSSKKNKTTHYNDINNEDEIDEVEEGFYENLNGNEKKWKSSGTNSSSSSSSGCILITAFNVNESEQQHQQQQQQQQNKGNTFAIKKEDPKKSSVNSIQ